LGIGDWGLATAILDQEVNALKGFVEGDSDVVRYQLACILVL
jgi:hypothetical protein